jgi:hypothetical protein
LIRQDLSLVGLNPLLVPEHLIQLPLISDDGALIGLDFPLVLKHLIELLLIPQQLGLVA